MTKEEAAKFAERCVSMTEISFVKEFYRLAAAALRGPTREQVEKVRGEWIADGEKVPVDENGCPRDWAKCSVCGEYLTASEEYDCTGHFCPACGAPMTDEAVDVMLKRMEEITNEH